jgi:hypothetical protein
MGGGVGVDRLGMSAMGRLFYALEIPSPLLVDAAADCEAKTDALLRDLRRVEAIVGLRAEAGAGGGAAEGAAEGEDEAGTKPLTATELSCAPPQRPRPSALLLGFSRDVPGERSLAGIFAGAGAGAAAGAAAGAQRRGVGDADSGLSSSAAACIPDPAQFSPVQLLHQSLLAQHAALVRVAGTSASAAHSAVDRLRQAVRANMRQESSTEAAGALPSQLASASLVRYRDPFMELDAEEERQRRKRRERAPPPAPAPAPAPAAAPTAAAPAPAAAAPAPAPTPAFGQFMSFGAPAPAPAPTAGFGGFQLGGGFGTPAPAPAPAPASSGLFGGAGLFSAAPAPAPAFGASTFGAPAPAFGAPAPTAGAFGGGFFGSAPAPAPAQAPGAPTSNTRRKRIR